MRQLLVQSWFQFRFYSPAIVTAFISVVALSCEVTEPMAPHATSPRGKTDTTENGNVVPDIAEVGVVCNRVCYNLGTGACNDPADWTKAKTLYDDHFGRRLPTSEKDFQWQSDPRLISVDAVRNTVFYGLPYGLEDQTYHDLYDFNPQSYARTTELKNAEIFSGITSLVNDVYEPSSSADRMAPYYQYNPYDYVPASLTHYQRRENLRYDVMATQWVLRMACDLDRYGRKKDEMIDAMRRCPDCDDVMAVHSRNDLYKIFEVRFVRINPHKQALEVSRPFKMISVDPSGHMFMHGPRYPYYWGKVKQGNTLVALRAKWRGELSGLMAQRLAEFGGATGALTPALIRLHPQSAPYASHATLPE